MNNKQKGRQASEMKKSWHSYQITTTFTY